MTKPIKSFHFPCNHQTLSCELYPPHPLTRQKKITISITSNHIIKIRAPIRTPLKTITALLTDHSHWIVKQLHKKKKPVVLNYTHLEPHLYLGKFYPLYIDENPNQKQNILFQNHQIYISVRYYTPYKIYALLDNAYHFQALQYFTQRIHNFQAQTPWINWKCPPILRIKKMTSRWGSFTNKNTGIITLNQHLIKACPQCIDYVILHELCHAAEMNHSKRFYVLLDKIMPDWRLWQSQIHQQSALLLYNPTPKADNR
ncbi:M48 family metallopeptidase [Commensalibacter oyaizuii]|uniref:SprT family zinc-dependent metalloprotease n=1 Tax=Commensalibacter oyaizuii TaxID=3043873 RepID=A0ABT6Q1A6_9PROT|nr:SprT family zinc-dependent metalloprotease [Commensalibacter sp. TBRC 16381]MDI2090871.1 SprT family zinc-dependent metalloprotease [Commensalibacter sp. TBRC 16381]